MQDTLMRTSLDNTATEIVQIISEIWEQELKCAERGIELVQVTQNHHSSMIHWGSYVSLWPLHTAIQADTGLL